MQRLGALVSLPEMGEQLSSQAMSKVMFHPSPAVGPRCVFAVANYFNAMV